MLDIGFNSGSGTVVVALGSFFLFLILIESDCASWFVEMTLHLVMIRWAVMGLNCPSPSPPQMHAFAEPGRLPGLQFQSRSASGLDYGTMGAFWSRMA